MQWNPDRNWVDKKQTTTPTEQLTWWGRWYRAWLGSSINYNIIHGMSSSSTCGLHEHQRRHYGNHPRPPSHSLTHSKPRQEQVPHGTGCDVDGCGWWSAACLPGWLGRGWMSDWRVRGCNMEESWLLNSNLFFVDALSSGSSLES